jgi:hypothetical protein
MKNTNFKLILSGLISFMVLCFANGHAMAVIKSADLLMESSDNKTVKGTVTAFHNYYLKNVEVTVKNTGSKALTDSLGRFEISASSGDVLLFTANGFEKNHRKVASDDDPISVNMILVPGRKYKKKAIANGHIYEKDLAYAVRHYSDFNNDFMKYSDMRELLEHELVGVIVKDLGKIQVFLHGEEELIRAELIGPRATDKEFVKHFYKRGGEEMGQASPSLGNRVSNHQSYTQIYERGGDISRGGLSNDNGAAIFVLDGRIVPSIDFLRPGDIKSVKLIRDVGTVRYGSHSANGVVLINTKHL